MAEQALPTPKAGKSPSFPTSGYLLELVTVNFLFVNKQGPVLFKGAADCGFSGYCSDAESIFCSYITTISHKAAVASAAGDDFTH